MLKIVYFSFLFLTLCSCTQGPVKDRDRYLNISFKSEVRSLDPRFGIDLPSAHAIKMLFEGLMYRELDGQITPALAESYEVSPDLKTYTFHLRNAYWTNGDPVTAYDFVYSWKSVVNPKTKTVGSHNFYPIKNVQKIITGELPIDAMGVQALDAQTLQVELEHPTPYFLEEASSVSFLPVNSRIDREQPNWNNTDGDSFICNGPFFLEKNQFGHEIFVKKNPKYWNANRVKLPGIKIAILQDPMTQLQLFEKGELDWIGKPVSKMPLEAVEACKKEGKLHSMPCLGVYWIFVNTKATPFNNKKMRQAFSYALNRKAITEHVLREQELPAMSLLPSKLSQQNEPYFLDNQGKNALFLFEEALNEMNLTREEFPEIYLNVAHEPVHMKVAQAVQEQWRQTLNVQVQIEHQDWKSHYSKLQSGDFQLGGMGWNSGITDPSYILQTFRYSSDGINMSFWEDPRYQALIAATEEEIDPGKRREYFHQAEALLMEEMPVIPIYFTTITYMKNEQLKDVYLSERSDVDFRWAYFSKR